MSKVVSSAEMMATIQWRLAITEFLRFNNRAKLDELSSTSENIPPLAQKWLEQLASGELRRPRGRPPKTKYSPELIVQLVFKQKLQAGLSFTNELGGDNNPCFYTVAYNLGRNVREVRRDFYKVPASRRQEIEKGLRSILEEFGELHPRHRKK